ncbi:MAG: hypothetical protein QOI10_1389 [Solirubrobacterales bacterium]|nr:hypothetical protein [Solirubrobacterales bacterium]
MRIAIAIAVFAAVVVVPGLASGHVERPAYWPDPARDRSVDPPVGGKVPKARSLSSALKAKPPGDTRVVCKPNSLELAEDSIAAARKHGYDIRPHDHRRLGRARARRLSRINRELQRRCEYREIQPAVFDSRNNDRVVIMPGLYKEPTSRAKPTFDPACDQYETSGDHPGEVGALSYTYQFHCPNDQNLIAVMGRKPGKAPAPDPPLYDRHGIPDLGRCIRCNLQIEGSGASADDVIIEAGSAKAGNGGPSAVGSKKDVGIRADRADGFVLRNVTVRHAREHNIYVLESDGYRLERFKTYYPGEYGVLTFVEDHGLIQNCDAVGGGDSGLYPGAPAETGHQRNPGTPFRYNQEIRRCDSHHNAAGYSATDGNAVHVDHNNFYDNSLGLTTDVVTAAGHPGFPGDSTLFEHNNIYSNNFNPYVEGSDVEAALPYPVGTGIWIAGGNYHIVRDNHIYDNWRRGTMLFSIPDALVCGPVTGNSQSGCDPSTYSTSFYNSYYGNVMGESPNGTAKPNGTDFWWDAFPNSKGNCWYDNSGPAPITSSPANLPDCDGGKDPDSSVGSGDAANEGELAACAVSFETGNYDPATCPWFASPAKPGTAAARAERRANRVAMRQTFFGFCDEMGTDQPTCAPYADLLASR